MDKIQVLIVDDHTIVRAGIRSLIESQPDMEVVGEARGGQEAFDIALKSDPDIVLMDLAMPGMNGIEATRLLKKRLPHVHVLALTMYDDEEFFFTLLREGASGYILKDSEPHQLIDAIRDAVNGQIFLSPSVAKALLESYNMATNGSEQDKYATLTHRERDVLRLLATGCTTRQMAETMVLSMRTVEKHRQAVMRKLGLSNREDLAKYAIRMGLLDPNINLF